MTQHLTVPLEVKALHNREFEGYGAVFKNVDYGGDIILPGAFKDTLEDHKADDSLPVMFWMHSPDQVPGKWLEMHEDDHGLYVKGVLADTQLGNEVRTLLGMKAIKGLSIGYMTRDRDYDSEGNRLLKKLDLHETSVVSLPMNPKAQIVHAKARLSEKGEYVPTNDELAGIKRDCEQFLRNKGFGRRAAIAGASAFFKGFTDEIFEDPKADNTLLSMELDAGLSDFQEKLLLQDLENSFRRYFNHGK